MFVRAVIDVYEHCGGRFPRTKEEALETYWNVKTEYARTLMVLCVERFDDANIVAAMTGGILLAFRAMSKTLF